MGQLKFYEEAYLAYHILILLGPSHRLWACIIFLKEKVSEHNKVLNIYFHDLELDDSNKLDIRNKLHIMSKKKKKEEEAIVP